LTERDAADLYAGKNGRGTQGMENMVPIIAILSLFVALPGMVFTFAYKSRKNKTELKRMEYQKEILRLELEKENTQLKLLEEENKKLDRIING
jgi:hypothetical protein